MPRILLAAHGFPPRENAGTEQYTARLARALRSRGWDVWVLAATQSPGEAMYTTRAEGLPDGVHLVRVIHNAPYAGRRTGGADAAIDTLFRRLCAEVRPDLIHLQHVASLSTTLPLSVPTVWTLHDAWGWCPAGGLLLRQDVDPVTPCLGPGPACPACASHSSRDGLPVAAALQLAGRLSTVIPAVRLHAAWKQLPSPVRERIHRVPAAPVTEVHAASWRQAHLSLARRCHTLISPSRWLADEAVKAGFPPAVILPHGVDAEGLPEPLASPARPFVFLGTIAPHKGPDLVQAAWRLSGVPHPLHVYGPAGADVAWASRVGGRGPLAAERVPAVLADAQALVLGSRWPENAPLVVLEARAVGCPVIAPSLGGLPELVTPGRDGWIYPPGDVAALAAALVAAAAHRIVPTPPPTLAAHIDALQDVYDHALGPAPGPRGGTSRSECSDE